jgi:hypothetical protein
LIVEFDASQNLVLIKTVSASQAATPSVQIAEIHLDKYVDDDERFKTVGKVLLDSLMIFAGEELSDASDQQEEEFIQLIERKANEGDVRAQRIMAGLCESRALKDRDPNLLDEVERWYKQAIAQGDQDAHRFFSKVWPKHKQHLLKWIARDDGG